jgi:hypothetical protein
MNTEDVTEKDITDLCLQRQIEALESCLQDIECWAQICGTTDPFPRLRRRLKGQLSMLLVELCELRSGGDMVRGVYELRRLLSEE